MIKVRGTPAAGGDASVRSKHSSGTSTTTEGSSDVDGSARRRRRRRAAGTDGIVPCPLCSGDYGESDVRVADRRSRSRGGNDVEGREDDRGRGDGETYELPLKGPGRCASPPAVSRRAGRSDRSGPSSHSSRSSRSRSGSGLSKSLSAGDLSSPFGRGRHHSWSSTVSPPSVGGLLRRLPSFDGSGRREKEETGRRIDTKPPARFDHLGRAISAKMRIGAFPDF